MKCVYFTSAKMTDLRCCCKTGVLLQPLCHEHTGKDEMHHTRKSIITKHRYVGAWECAKYQFPFHPCGTVYVCVFLCILYRVTVWLIGCWVAPSGPFSCSWLNALGSVNIDKCALQELLPPCSSPMPQTNEFLKTASIKPQARSIDHRVDFISATEHGLVHTSLPRCLTLQLSFAVGFSWSRGSQPRAERYNQGRSVQ